MDKTSSLGIGHLAIRFAVAGVFAALAIGAGLSAYSHVLRYAAPQLLTNSYWADGIAAAIAADRILVQDGNAANLVQTQRLAKFSVAEEPVNPTALRVLGLVAEARSQQPLAEKFLALSVRTSRRDIGTQLWLIDRAVQRNDLRGALEHYDSALRISPEAQSVLFPILSSALEENEVRTRVGGLLRIRPPWAYAFLDYAISTNPRPVHVAQLLVASRPLPNTPEFRWIEQRLISALAARNGYTAARQYLSIVSPKNLARIGSDGFDDATTDERYRPLTWDPQQGSALGAAFERNGQVARAFANPGGRGVALRRVVAHRPGGYRLQIRVRPVNVDPGSEHLWQISCIAGDQKKLVWAAPPSHGVGFNVIVTNLRIPDACPNQLIELVMVGGSGQIGHEILVEGFKLNVTE